MTGQGGLVSQCPVRRGAGGYGPHGGRDKSESTRAQAAQGDQDTQRGLASINEVTHLGHLPPEAPPSHPLCCCSGLCQAPQETGRQRGGPAQLTLRKKEGRSP